MTEGLESLTLDSGEISKNVQTGGNMELELDEIDMGTKPRVLDLDLEQDEPETNLANENIKVVKISGDSNTLNMINK